MQTSTSAATMCHLVFYCVFMTFFIEAESGVIFLLKHKIAYCGQVPNYNKSSIVLIYTVQLSSVEQNVCNCCVL